MKRAIEPARRSKKQAKKPAPVPDLPFMSTTHYAARRGVRLQTVRDWIREGRVVQRSNGRIDVARSDALLDGKAGATPQGGSASIIDEASKWTQAEAQRVERNYAALQRKLDFDLKSGAVVPIAEVVAEFSAKLSIVRQRLLDIGANLAPRLLHRKSPEEVKALIDQEVTRILEELTFEAGKRSKQEAA